MSLITVNDLDVETREGWVGDATVRAMHHPTDIPCGTIWLFQFGRETYYTLNRNDSEKYEVCDQFGTVLYVFQ